jgi:8-oxo-dGTP pyrophosphatase MutT (NUDIX family)
MDKQESVIVIIKKGSNILLQKNEQWQDLSFIGGKAEPEDRNIPVNTAYREVEEELFIRRNIDFELVPLQPNIISFEKVSQRTHTNRSYTIFPFFLKAIKNIDKQLDIPNNVWIKMTELESYSDELIPLSDIVKRVIPELSLSSLDSFGS